MKKQTYPYWRPLGGDNWAYYTHPRKFVATRMLSWADAYWGQWFIPHLKCAGPFSKLDDAKRLVEAVWGPEGILNKASRQ